MTKISAQIVADSISPQGNRLTSLLVTFPRFILAELNTHRMLSKNSASSRAIPFNKMVESVQNNPFVPIAWQKDHKGMQGTEYFTDSDDISSLNCMWLASRNSAVGHAEMMYHNKITKQLANRILEPYMWHTVLITGCDEGWNNFFDLRCPQYETGIGIFRSWKNLCLTHSGGNAASNSFEYLSNVSDLEKLSKNRGQAEIHMMALAEAIYDAMGESTPKQLKPNQWHVPFENQIDQIIGSLNFKEGGIMDKAFDEGFKVKISTAMAARTSYTVVGEEKEVDYKNLLSLHDKLIEMRHSSPLEHCARAMSNNEYNRFIKGECTPSYLEVDHLIAPVSSEGWCRNYRGFLQYRYLIEENS